MTRFHRLLAAALAAWVAGPFGAMAASGPPFPGLGTIAGTAAAGNSTAAVNVAALGCDLASNQAQCLNNANSLFAGFRPVYIPPGMSLTVSSQVNLPSNLTLINDGYVKLADGANTFILFGNGNGDGTASVLANGDANPAFNPNLHDIVLEGNGTYDGNRANQTTSNVLSCINVFNGWRNVTIRGNLTITNCKNFPINLWKNGIHARIGMGVTTSYSGSSTECANQVEDCWFFSAVSHHLDDYGIAMYGAITNSGAANSVAHHNGAGGFVVLNDGGQPLPSNNIAFINDDAYFNKASGFAALENPGGTAVHTNVSFISDRGHHNGQGGLANYGGLYLGGVTGLTVRNNIFHDDGNGPAASVCIRMAGAVNWATFEGDECYNEGQGGTLGVGMSLSSTATHVTMMNEHYFDNQTTKTMSYGCNGGFGNGTSGAFILNKYEGTLGAADNCTRGSDTVDVPFNPGIFATALTGAAFTMKPTDFTHILQLTQTSAVASQTINLPTVGNNGYDLRISNYGAAITALTFSPAVTGWQNGSTLAAGPGVTMVFRWNVAAGAWIREL